MRVEDVLGVLVAESGMSGREVSRTLGKAETWVSTSTRPGRRPALATVADVADVAGVDVVLVDRATGEAVGVVEPPRRAAMEQQE